MAISIWHFIGWLKFQRAVNIMIEFARYRWQHSFSTNGLPECIICQIGNSFIPTIVRYSLSIWASQALGWPRPPYLNSIESTQTHIFDFISSAALNNKIKHKHSIMYSVRIVSTQYTYCTFLRRIELATSCPCDGRIAGKEKAVLCVSAVVCMAQMLHIDGEPAREVDCLY